jgi:hypothetical protein
MQLYFVMFDSPFFWVRAGALQNPAAGPSGIRADAIFQTYRIAPGSIPVFNRFSRSKMFSAILAACKIWKIPYIFDIDDLFWKLPNTSCDEASSKTNYTDSIRELIQQARVITTTNQILADEIHKEFGCSDIAVIPNASLSGYEIGGGAVIANTDNFKLDQNATAWFREELHLLAEAGVPVHVLGENPALFSEDKDLVFRSAPRVSYSEYLRGLTAARHRFGIIPVSQNSYSDCKSAIKALEFLSAGMRVYASDVGPYRELAKQHPHPQLILVPNTQSAWNSAFKEMIALMPSAERSTMQGTLKMEVATRRAQIEGWRGVVTRIQAEVPKNGHRVIRAILMAMLVAQRVKSLIMPSGAR